MEANAMITVGLVPSQQLVSLLTDDEGNWRDVPEGETVVPLVKIEKPAQGTWEPNVVWFADRVERQWVEGTPAPLPTYTPEAWVSMHLTSLQILSLQRLEMALLTAAKPLGSNMAALKGWLEGMMLASVDPTPRTFDLPPCSYEQASAEAVTDLSSPNPET
jgi:hypothetical protein